MTIHSTNFNSRHHFKSSAMTIVFEDHWLGKCILVSAFSNACLSVSNQSVKLSLKKNSSYWRCMTHHQPVAWCRGFPLAEWWYAHNTISHVSLKMTPFEALCGYKPASIPFFLEEITSVHLWQILSSKGSIFFNLLKDNFQHAQAQD